MSPTIGESDGEADPITIHYDLAGLGAGTHTATIAIIDPAAYNNPQTVKVTLDITTVKPDFDKDGDVDLDDWGHFQACLTGVGVAQANEACVDTRLDDDDDIDKNDTILFRQCLSGAGIAADPGCMN